MNATVDKKKPVGAPAAGSMLSGVAARRVAILSQVGAEKEKATAIQYSKTPGTNLSGNELNIPGGSK